MSKTSTNMLRTRRRDNNVKPNRRLDRKSSRGMIYENEELRLKTININAEIERGQSDIKKLRRENEMLKKEIWCLRDEYEKLDRMLREKNHDGFYHEESSQSSSGTSSEQTGSQSDSESSEEEPNNDPVVETTQNTANETLHEDFDHLSIVPEEDLSTDTTNTTTSDHRASGEKALKPDEGYPICPFTPKHFFAPLPNRPPTPPKPISFLTFQPTKSSTISAASDLKTLDTEGAINEFFPVGSQPSTNNSFSTGGNLEELLNDIHNISQEILEISETSKEEEFKSELSVMLMPQPMPLIGFEKYNHITNLSLDQPDDKASIKEPQEVSKKEVEEEKPLDDGLNPEIIEEPKSSLKRKVSLLHFKGKRTEAAPKKEQTVIVTPPSPQNLNNTNNNQNNNATSSESEKPQGPPTEKSVSNSPERPPSSNNRKHKHKKHKTKGGHLSRRKASVSTDRLNLNHLRERSFSICTDRSNFMGGGFLYDEYLTSDRERTNSVSSCGTNNRNVHSGGGGGKRKLSNLSHVPTSGKIPWCACWGNGCL